MNAAKFVICSLSLGLGAINMGQSEGTFGVIDQILAFKLNRRMNSTGRKADEEATSVEVNDSASTQSTPPTIMAAMPTLSGLQAQVSTLRYVDEAPASNELTITSPDEIVPELPGVVDFEPVSLDKVVDAHYAKIRKDVDAHYAMKELFYIIDALRKVTSRGIISDSLEEKRANANGENNIQETKYHAWEDGKTVVHHGYRGVRLDILKKLANILQQDFGFGRWRELSIKLWDEKNRESITPKAIDLIFDENPSANKAYIQILKNINEIKDFQMVRMEETLDRSADAYDIFTFQFLERLGFLAVIEERDITRSSASTGGASDNDAQRAMIKIDNLLETRREVNTQKKNTQSQDGELSIISSNIRSLSPGEKIRLYTIALNSLKSGIAGLELVEKNEHTELIQLISGKEEFIQLISGTLRSLALRVGDVYGELKRAGGAPQSLVKNESREIAIDSRNLTTSEIVTRLDEVLRSLSESAEPQSPRSALMLSPRNKPSLKTLLTRSVTVEKILKRIENVTKRQLTTQDDPDMPNYNPVPYIMDLYRARVIASLDGLDQQHHMRQLSGNILGINGQLAELIGDGKSELKGNATSREDTYLTI